MINYILLDSAKKKIRLRSAESEADFWRGVYSSIFSSDAVNKLECFDTNRKLGEWVLPSELEVKYLSGHVALFTSARFSKTPNTHITGRAYNSTKSVTITGNIILVGNNFGYNYIESIPTREEENIIDRFKKGLAYFN